MSTVIKSPTPIPEEREFTVFLAGPMRGAPKWQRTVPKLAEAMGLSGVTWLSPCSCQRWATWKQQADWETSGLRACDVVLFWIPNQETPVEGRDYAQTTRMELAENLALGKKVILGIDSDIRGSRYMKYKAEAYGIAKVHKSLEDCLTELKELLGQVQMPVKN